MILYNTSMGVAAGLALILVSLLVGLITAPVPVAAAGGDSQAPTASSTRTFDARLWAVVFGALGLVLAPLGALMAATQPLIVNPPLNYMFGEPCLLLGVSLLGAAVYLWHLRGDVTSLQRVDLTPVWVVLFGLGGVLLACAAAVARFEIVGSAPAEEPITGLLHEYPVVENTFFVLLYLGAAAGALLLPVAQLRTGGLLTAARRLWLITGVILAVFVALNFYTHAGMEHNLRIGTDYRF